jgi:hypothetical protein
VIAGVYKRGHNLGGLLGYLFGPGRHEEHRDEHLIAAWHGAEDLAALQPRRLANGRHDLAGLADLLRQPVRAGLNPPRDWLWHCSIRNDPSDPILTDAHWAHIAVEVVEAVGLARRGDVEAVRWVAVRHNDDHIHVVATLVRQDGRTAWPWRDYLKARRCCDELEQRFGLHGAGPMDGTSHHRPGAAELNKAQRLGHAVPARDELRRIVREMAAASSTEDEFFARLADAGVLVGKRASTTDPGEWVGYKVAHPAHTTRAGQPVWFSGGGLANDLTLPKLRQRWAGQTGNDQALRISPTERATTLASAGEAIRGAADAIGQLAGTNPEAAHPVAQAASDTLAAVAATVEGRQGGPLTRAVDLFDKASREPGGQVAPANPQSAGLRALSRLVRLMGQPTRGQDGVALLALLGHLARLSDALAVVRETEQRPHQAQAARQVAVILRTAADAEGRLGPVDPALVAADLTKQPRTTPPARRSTRDISRSAGR